MSALSPINRADVDNNGNSIAGQYKHLEITFLRSRNS